MEEPTCPDSLRNKASFRKATVIGLELLVSALNEAQKEPQHEAVFLTGSALISATISEFPEDRRPFIEGPDGKQILNLAGIVATRDRILSEAESVNGPLELLDSGAFVHLTNVFVRPLNGQGGTYHFDQMLLFVDQIVGMSIGVADALQTRQSL